ncbi:MAG TPA: hypothetical protein PL059_12450 [Spirochaetota bacterium]|nr:hypothetical protein [Spirochaetota bacterium]HOM10026.1 hypothetical protein [Spirochaetota bacterium]HPP50267.1 hypothetical protein [Spirochaetota bacterium]
MKHIHKYLPGIVNTSCIVLFFFTIAVLTQCSSYITKEEKLKLKNYEGEYILLQDAVRNDIKIIKGERVRVKITATDDYIKVYAMPANVDIVKGEWLLILYLFPDDFEKEKFDVKVFEDRLYQVAKPVK